MYTATKSFTTPLRRFAEGKTIAADEIDGPLTADDRIALGHIAISAQTLEPVCSGCVRQDDGTFLCHGAADPRCAMHDDPPAEEAAGDRVASTDA
jgi:hypothetical protein